MVDPILRLHHQLDSDCPVVRSSSDYQLELVRIPALPCSHQWAEEGLRYKKICIVMLTYIHPISCIVTILMLWHDKYVTLYPHISFPMWNNMLGEGCMNEYTVCVWEGCSWDCFSTAVLCVFMCKCGNKTQKQSKSVVVALRTPLALQCVRVCVCVCSGLAHIATPTGTGQAQHASASPCSLSSSCHSNTPWAHPLEKPGCLHPSFFCPGPHPFFFFFFYPPSFDVLPRSLAHHPAHQSEARAAGP